VTLLPRPEQVTLAPVMNPERASPLYCLPVEISTDKQILSRVQILVRSPHGAEMLMGGIRTIHARHPGKPKREFITQVLATGRPPVRGD
jgi:hypothetical protein